MLNEETNAEVPMYAAQRSVMLMYAKRGSVSKCRGSRGERCRLLLPVEFLGDSDIFCLLQRVAGRDYEVARAEHQSFGHLCGKEHFVLATKRATPRLEAYKWL